jgi:hypothetical protein
MDRAAARNLRMVTNSILLGVLLLAWALVGRKTRMQ